MQEIKELVYLHPVTSNIYMNLFYHKRINFLPLLAQLQAIFFLIAPIYLCYTLRQIISNPSQILYKRFDKLN